MRFRASLARRTYSLAAMRDARDRRCGAVFDFSDCGAENEATLRRNEATFADVELLQRPLYGAAERDHSVDLFGRRLDLPVMMGPTRLSGLFRPGGEMDNFPARFPTTGYPILSEDSSYG